MQLRVTLRSPQGEVVVRDVVGSTWAEPEGRQGQIIGEDLWALPGLVDGHAHIASAGGELGPGDFDGARRRVAEALRAGVGLILDKGWSDLTAVEVLDRVPIEERPDMEAAGRLLAVAEGYYPGFAREIADDELDRAVEEAAEEGRGWVKLIGDWPRKGQGPMPNFDTGQLARAVRVARRSGAKVAVHTMAREVPSMSVAAGVDSIEHGLFLTGEDVAALGARRGLWVPTVTQMEAVVEELGPESSGGRMIREGLANVASLLPDAAAAGVRVLTGTDRAVETRLVAREAIRLWELGMSVSGVIDAVSTAGLESTGRPAGFDVGEPANAVLFAESPLRDPRVLAHPHTVIRLGRIVA